MAVVMCANSDKPIAILPDDHDDITHPSHYCEGRQYEPREVILDWQLSYNLGCVVKYLARAGRKVQPGLDADASALRDLEKAQDYLEREIRRMVER